MKDPRIIAAANKIIKNHGLEADKLSVKMPQAILIHIASCIRNWSDIAPYLGFEIEDFEEVFQSSCSEKSKKLFVLEKWSNKLGEEASFCKLIEIFLIADMEDLAERVCEYYAIWHKEKITITSNNHRNHYHYLNHTHHHKTDINPRLSLQKCVPYQFAYSAHQKVHHPLMYTRRGRPTKRFDIEVANANRISKPHPLSKREHVTLFEEVRRSGSHDTAPIRVIQLDDDNIGRGKWNKRRRCAQRCGLCIYCIIVLLFGLMSAAAFILAYTIVRPLPHPPGGVTLLTRDHPILIGWLKPFYTHTADIHIVNVNNSASLNDTKGLNFTVVNDSGQFLNNAQFTAVEYYQMRCRNLRTLNTTVDKKGVVTTSEGHTHILYEDYLVAGSTIDFHFKWNMTAIEENTSQAPILSEDTTTAKEATPTDEAISSSKRTISILERTIPSSPTQCIIELKVYDNLYAVNNQDTSSSKQELPYTTVCIQNTTQHKQKQTFHFTLEAHNSSHRLVTANFKMHTLQTTESLEYKITGTQMTFDLNHQRPSCVATPTNTSSCTLHFRNYHIYRFSEEDCILGRLVNSSRSHIEIKYWTTNNEYVMIMHYVLVGLGLVFLIVFSGLVSGCISMCNCG